MDDNTELIAYHGWAFDRTCWEPWINLLPDRISFKCFDRGYFGEPEPAEFGPDARKKILFTHSFGLHQCPAGQLREADLLVVFGGFKSFHPKAAQFNRRSRWAIKQMQKKMRERPNDVLADFWKNSFQPGPVPDVAVSGINIPVLLEDLRRLDRAELEPGLLKETEKICILHGSSDRIVPNGKARTLYEILKHKASYFEIKQAGHALPFTHTGQCHALIGPELNRI